MSNINRRKIIEILILLQRGAYISGLLNDKESDKEAAIALKEIGTILQNNLPNRIECDPNKDLTENQKGYNTYHWEAYNRIEELFK